MKNLLLFCVLCTSVFLTSCGDDDSGMEEQPLNNVLEFDGTTINLKTLAINLFRGNNKIWISESDNFKLSDNGREVILDPDGITDFIFFNVANENDVETGSYSFNTDDTILFTFFGEVVLGYNTADETAQTRVDITSGTLEVLIEGDVYELKWDCLTADGKIIKGNYKAPADQLIN